MNGCCYVIMSTTTDPCEFTGQCSLPPSNTSCTLSVFLTYAVCLIPKTSCVPHHWLHEFVLKILLMLLMQDIDEKAEEAYRKMEDAFRVQLGLVPDGVAVT